MLLWLYWKMMDLPQPEVKFYNIIKTKLVKQLSRRIKPFMMQTKWSLKYKLRKECRIYRDKKTLEGSRKSLKEMCGIWRHPFSGNWWTNSFTHIRPHSCAEGSPTKQHHGAVLFMEGFRGGGSMPHLPHGLPWKTEVTRECWHLLLKYCTIIILVEGCWRWSCWAGGLYEDVVTWS